MLNSKFNKNILSDVERIMRGETVEKKPLPQSLKDAAVAAAKDLRLLRESIVTIESRRDTLRAHLEEGLKTCGCNATVDTIKQFEDEVNDRLAEGGDPTPLATPAQVAKKTKNPPVDAKKMPLNKGIRGTKQPPKDIGEEVQTELRDFISALTQEEVDYIGEIINEATSDKKMKKAINDLYNKYFNRVQVDIFDLGKISKEIQSAIEKGTVDATLPELVKKYRKN